MPVSAPPRPSREQARQLARAHARARRQRILRIRRRAVGLAVALFLGAWVTIFAQLASGHDPALSAAADRRVAAKSAVPAGSSASRATASDQSGSTASDSSAPQSTGSDTTAAYSASASSDSSSSSGQSATASPAPVNTSQS